MAAESASPTIRSLFRTFNRELRIGVSICSIGITRMRKTMEESILIFDLSTLSLSTFSSSCLQSSISRPYTSRRQDALPQYVRNMLRDPSKSVQECSFQRLNNLTTLLRNQRIHGELLARYNPVYGKSEQERIRATANRVGLEVPNVYEDVEAAAQTEGIDVKYRS